MKIDFLQIGFVRCGTTFLRRNVYPNNPHLECIYAGIQYWELYKLLLRDFILADGFEYDQQSFERKFAEICPTVFTNKQAQVRGIMFYPFTFLPRRRFDRKNVIDRINQSFPEVKIIMGIRSQPIWVRSLYSMYVNSQGGMLGVHDFVESILGNELLVAHYIDWFPLVSYLYKLFSSERVLIYPFEELRESPQGTANRIFDFLEVPRVQIDESPINPSRSKEILAIRRFFNHLMHFEHGGSSDFTLDSLHLSDETKPSRMLKWYNTSVETNYRKSTNFLCYAASIIINGIFRVKSQVELEERHLRMIERRYSSNNKKLSELLGVDLSGYGYP